MRNNRIEETMNYSLYSDQFEKVFDTSLDYADAIFEKYGKVEDVEISRLVSAQDEVNDVHCQELADAKYFDGALGLRFEDCDEIFVVDGNHRINGAMMCDIESVEMTIVTIRYNAE